MIKRYFNASLIRARGYEKGLPERPSTHRWAPRMCTVGHSVRRVRTWRGCVRQGVPDGCVLGGVYRVYCRARVYTDKHGKTRQNTARHGQDRPGQARTCRNQPGHAGISQLHAESASYMREQASYMREKASYMREQASYTRE